MITVEARATGRRRPLGPGWQIPLDDHRRARGGMALRRARGRSHARARGSQDGPSHRDVEREPALLCLSSRHRFAIRTSSCIASVSASPDGRKLTRCPVTKSSFATEVNAASSTTAAPLSLWPATRSRSTASSGGSRASRRKEFPPTDSSACARLARHSVGARRDSSAFLPRGRSSARRFNSSTLGGVALADDQNRRHVDAIEHRYPSGI